MSSLALAPLAFLRHGLAPLPPSAVFDFWAREFGSIASRRRVLARIVARRGESPRAVTLELQPNRRFAGFTPGQHLNLTVEVAGRRVTRSYSPTGTPRADGRLSLTVQAVAGGLVSQHLFTRTAIGDVVELSAAFGDMSLPDVLSGPLVLLAAGSGITPLMSLTRELARRGMPVPTTLVYWARRRADLCFLSELKALAAREPNFRLRVALTGDAATSRDELRGRPSAELLDAVVPELSTCRVYTCGPAGFVAQIESLCMTRAAAFHAEAFTPPVLAPPAGDQTVSVTLARSKRVLNLKAGEPLLAALEARGVKPACGCRMGICNTCACRKRAGITRDLRSGSASAGPDPNLRICISSAQSDLTLDL